MFGYVSVYHKDLSPAAQERYQAAYCGLCRALRGRYGVVGQSALSYDMAFTAVLLTALYDPPTEYGRGRCALHPAKARPRAANEWIDYAADMTALLAYYNFLDDWQDDGSHAARALAGRLARYLPALQTRWPRQCAAVKTQLAALEALESAGCADLDALCNAFGALLGAVLAPREDLWAPVLGRMGQALGGFIYLMDAYDDLERDAKRGNFNALAALHSALPAQAFEARCKALLEAQMALCAQAFGLLPIVKDTPEGEILYNTLYAGVWGRYELRHAARQRRAGNRSGKEAVP